MKQPNKLAKIALFAVVLLFVSQIYLASAVVRLSNQLTKMDSRLLVRFEFTVEKFDLSKGVRGQYFEFPIAQMDAQFGEGKWGGETFLVLIEPTSRFETVEMWPNPPPSSTGFGRVADDTKIVRWELGEVIRFIGG